MSADALTFFFCLSLWREQQSGLRRFGNYEERTRDLAGKLIAGEYWR